MYFLGLDTSFLIISALLQFSLGLTVYVSGRRDPINISFSIITLMIFLWNISAITLRYYFFVLNHTDIELFNTIHILYFTFIFLAGSNIALFNFSLKLSNNKSKFLKYLLYLSISIVVVLAFMDSKYIIVGLVYISENGIVKSNHTFLAKIVFVYMYTITSISLYILYKIPRFKGYSFLLLAFIIWFLGTLIGGVFHADFPVMSSSLLITTILISIVVFRYQIFNSAIKLNRQLLKSIKEKKETDELISKLNTAVEQSPVSIVITDLEGNIEYVNPKFCLITGYTYDEALGQNPSVIKSGEQPEEYYKKLWDTISVGKTWTGDFHNKKKNGDLFWERATIGPITNETGDTTHFLAIKEDITELKKAEQVLKENEEQFRLLAENTLDTIWTTNKNLDLTYGNKAVFQLLGYTPEEFIGLNPKEFTTPESMVTIRESTEKLLSNYEQGIISQEIFEVQHIRKDGTLIDVEITADILLNDKEEFNGFQGRSINITKRNKAEKALRNSEEKFKQLSNLTFEGIVIHDAGIALDVNISLAKMFGFEPNEIIGQNIIKLLVAEKDHGAIQENMKKNIASPYELDGIKKDGSRFPIEVEAKIFINKENKKVRVAAVRDISQRKKVELALRESENRYKLLFNSASDVFFIMKDNIIIDCNQKTLEIFNCTREQIIGQTPFKFSPHTQPNGRESQEMAMIKIKAVLSGNPQFFEWKHTTYDGQPFDAEVSLNSIELSNGLHIQAIVRDITDRKQLESQLFQSQKMEAIGQFAGGIAHDFNNILTAILGFAEIGLMEKKGDTILRGIQSSSLRAANLVKKLLGFSRKQIIEPLVLDVIHLIDDLQKMLNRMIGEDIDINKSYDSNLPMIFADPGQIEQIIVNLVVNARDAINSKENPNDKRLITIGLDKVKIQTSKQENMFKISKGSYLIISVSDTGTGMDKKTQQKIFEPFFTTKEEGKGTGLGMSTVFGIIKQNNGFITVYSEIGMGTTFNIYWPVIENLEMDKTKDIEQENPIEGNEIIVLVEDDKDIITMVENSLTKLGYTIIAYSDPVIALEEIPLLTESIDIIITDVIMPHMNGKIFADKLALSKPDLIILYSSGYTDDHIVKAGILKKDVNFISKPYSLIDLTKKIKELVDNT